MDLKKNQIPCTRVRGLEEKTKYHVPGYMNLKKKQNIMYMNLKKTIFLCVAQGVGEARRKMFFSFFDNFFQHVKKLTNF